MKSDVQSASCKPSLSEERCAPRRRLLREHSIEAGLGVEKGRKWINTPMQQLGSTFRLILLCWIPHGTFFPSHLSFVQLASSHLPCRSCDMLEIPRLRLCMGKREGVGGLDEIGDPATGAGNVVCFTREGVRETER